MANICGLYISFFSFLFLSHWRSVGYMTIYHKFILPDAKDIAANP